MTVDYAIQAKAYISSLEKGAISPHSDRFIEILKLLKNLRKRRKDEPRYRPLYRELASLSFKALQAEVSVPLAGRFTLINTGEAHLFAGLIELDREKWFIKTVPAAAADELEVVRALMDGKIPRSGRHYRFSVPESVLLTPHLITYISHAVSDREPLVQDLGADPNDVGVIVRALAETNASLGGFAGSDCPPPLPRHPTALDEMKKSRFTGAFGLDSPAVDELYDVFLAIRSGWFRLEKRAGWTRWGLAHGDLASNNATVADGGILLYLDLGAVGFAPLGSDLYWLLFRNRETPASQRRIVADYCRELAGHGIAISEEEVAVNAFMRYAQKWLFPSRRGTKTNLDHIRATQCLTLRMIEGKAPFST